MSLDDINKPESIVQDQTTTEMTKVELHPRFWVYTIYSMALGLPSAEWEGTHGVFNKQEGDSWCF